jgi:hypothetical protein
VVSAAGDVCTATCGASGQVCCGNGNNGTCNTGLGCAGRNDNAGVPGMCGPCGGAGQICCTVVADAGITQCTGTMSCVVGATDNTCGTCGASGQPCCGVGNAGTCTAGAALACTGRNAGMGMAGTCGPCGGAGQACCPVAGGPPVDGGVTACTGALACLVATAGNECGTCGGAGQPCCGVGNAGTCTAGLGLVCTGRNRGMGMPGTCAAAPPPDAGTPDAPAGQ